MRLSSLFSGYIIDIRDEQRHGQDPGQAPQGENLAQTVGNDEELLFVTAHRDPICGTVLADLRAEQVNCFITMAIETSYVVGSLLVERGRSYR